MKLIRVKLHIAKLPVDKKEASEPPITDQKCGREAKGTYLHLSLTT